MNEKNIIESIATLEVGKYDPKVAKNFVAGNESNAYAAEVTATNIQNITSDVELILAGNENNEDGMDASVNATSVKLASQAAVLALDPMSVLRASTSFASPVAGNEAAISMSNGALSDGVSIVAGNEAFDGVRVEPDVKFNVMYTAMANRLDAGLDLLFPMIPFDAKSSGVAINVRVNSVINDITRSATGSSIVDALGKTPLVKLLNDPDKIDIDKNKLVPVFRNSGDNQNSTLFETNVTPVQVEENGQKVLTAPLLMGKDIEILGISQTDATLAAGKFNIQDALDPNVKISKLVYKVTGTNAAGTTVTEYFNLNTSNANVKFVPTTTGNVKQILLSVNNLRGAVSTDKNVTLTADGAVSEILSNLPQGYIVTMRVKLSGDGNTQTGNISVATTLTEVVEVKTAGGDVVVSGADYDKIVAVYATAGFTSYTPEAYHTNSNARFGGIHITSDGYQFVYNINYRTGFSFSTPIVSNGPDGDYNYISDAVMGVINSGRAKLKASGYRVLNNFIDYMDGSEGGIEGPAELLFDRKFIKESIDLTTITDGRRSGERNEDVAEALMLRIRNDAVALYVESNYGVALENELGTTKATVVIVTDVKTGAILASAGIKDDSLFNYRIAITNSPAMRGRVVFGFTVFDGNRNKVPNVFNFGNCCIAPDLTLRYTDSSNGVADKTKILPRYDFIVWQPILGVYDITGVESVLGKLN